MAKESFKILKTGFDTGINNPADKYASGNDKLKSLLDACYWQMVYKGYLDDEIDAVMGNLSQNSDVLNMVNSPRFPLAIEILSTYELQTKPGSDYPDDITGWIIDSLDTILNPVADDDTDIHPLLNIMSLVNGNFKPSRFNSALSDIEREANARRDAGKGLFKQRVEDISDYINWCVGMDFHGLTPETMAKIDSGLNPATLGRPFVVPGKPAEQNIEQPSNDSLVVAPWEEEEKHIEEPVVEEPPIEEMPEPAEEDKPIKEPVVQAQEEQKPEPAKAANLGDTPIPEPKPAEQDTPKPVSVNIPKHSGPTLSNTPDSYPKKVTNMKKTSTLTIPDADSDPFAKLEKGTEPEEVKANEPVGSNVSQQDDFNVFKEKAKANRPAQRVLTDLVNLCVSREQMEEALNEVKDIIASDDMNAQYLLEYTPGITPSILVDILQNRTTAGRIRQAKQASSGASIPHTNLTGGSTFQTGVDTPLGPIEIPRGFAQDNSAIIWSDPVITSMGFPFINFKSPEILAILKEKDPKKVKEAYKKVKKLMNKAGLSKPIKVLKDFKAAKGVQCALNRITIDAGEVLANNGGEIMASVHPRYAKDPSITIGDVALERDFVIELYRVLSPVKGAKAYIQQMGVTEEEYVNIIARDKRPPFYIFVPKDNMRFVKAPAGFIASLFTSNNKPTLVEAKMGSHFGGFIMPFRTTKLLFTEI